MSDATNGAAAPSSAGPAIAERIDEVQAIFPSDASLQDAIARLTGAGFDRAELSLPAASPSGEQATPEQGAANPDTETDHRQARTLQTSMAGSVGAMAAAGVAIATGGVGAVVLGAAAAAGLGAGALAGAASTAAQGAQHEAREQAAAAGQLVLSVRVSGDDSRRRAEQELRAAGATRVEALTRADAGVSSAGWTG